MPRRKVKAGKNKEPESKPLRAKSIAGAPPKESAQLEQDPHQVSGKKRSLESAIGREVRNFRHQLNMTVAQLSQAAGLSAGMLSKIENGQTSPSLATLPELSQALQVPVTSFFRGFEEERSATFVSAGQGLPIERRGTRAGHQYALLGHGFSRGLAVEPYLVTLTEDSDVFPIFQHDGVDYRRAAGRPAIPGPRARSAATARSM